jgi:hypothetical protein
MISGVGLWSLAGWDFGFESCWGHGYLSLCEYCELSGRYLCNRPIPRLEESYRLFVLVSVATTFYEVRQNSSIMKQ